jgi:hypothetical protein
MASYGPAVTRITQMLTDKAVTQFTPNTITVTPEGHIKSYALVIGERLADGCYLVHRDNSTPTTNRHIRALRMALANLGYTEGRTLSTGHTVWTTGVNG